MTSDLNTLLDMGFEKARVEIAVQNSVQGALEWLEKNQDKSIEEITVAQAEAKVNAGIGSVAADLNPGDDVKSLVCNDCQRKFKGHAQAELHASKSGHVDFAESTEEVIALTEEEKRAKLDDMRRRLAEKRASGSELDKVDKKKNEEIRRKSTKETQDIKEDLKKKEQLKEAAAKKKEKQDEIAAKARIKEKIAADKEERRLKSEKDKAEREGRAVPAASTTGTLPTLMGPVASKPASAYTETRLRLQLPNGNIQKAFSVDSTLFEVASAVNQHSGLEVGSFTQNFPKKVFDAVDFGASLRELGLVPSASLIVK